MDFITPLLSVLIGGGLLSLIQFFITRHDNKNDKFKKVFSVIEELTKKVEQFSAKSEERYIVTTRVRILRFADELLEERWHSKDSWDQCLSDITEYEQYCEKHPGFKNNQTAATVAYIKKMYDERFEKRDFYKHEEEVKSHE